MLLSSLFLFNGRLQIPQPGVDIQDQRPASFRKILEPDLPAELSIRRTSPMQPVDSTLYGLSTQGQIRVFAGLLCAE